MCTPLANAIPGTWWFSFLFQRCQAGRERVFRRSPCNRSQRYRPRPRVPFPSASFGPFELCFGCAKHFGRDGQSFLFNSPCREPRCRAPYGAAAAGECSKAVSDDIRISVLHANAIQGHLQLVGHQLRDRCRGPLAMGRGACQNRNFARWLHFNVAGLVRPDRCFFDQAGNTQPDDTALRACEACFACLSRYSNSAAARLSASG